MQVDELALATRVPVVTDDSSLLMGQSFSPVDTGGLGPPLPRTARPLDTAHSFPPPAGTGEELTTTMRPQAAAAAGSTALAPAPPASASSGRRARPLRLTRGEIRRLLPKRAPAGGEAGPTEMGPDVVSGLQAKGVLSHVRGWLFGQHPAQHKHGGAPEGACPACLLADHGTYRTCMPASSYRRPFMRACIQVVLAVMIAGPPPSCATRRMRPQGPSIPTCSGYVVRRPYPTRTR